MAKVILGVDIGSDSLKLALCRDGEIKKTAVARMPANLLKDGRITSPQSLGELLRTTMKEEGIRASQAAVSLSTESAYIRTVTMPRMNVDQLLYNIPYEFNDYITDELNNYIFDYAMITDLRTLEEKSGQKNGGKTKKKGLKPGLGKGKASNDNDATELIDNSQNQAYGFGGDSLGAPAENSSDPATMELMIVAVPKATLAEMSSILRTAGLRLAKAAPSICGFISLIRLAEEVRGGGEPREYCILDLGSRAVRMHMFKGDRHMVTRTLEVGLSGLDNVLAEAFNVDVHLAHTYLISNHDECQNREECIAAYNNIAVELMRALNFYRFSNPDSQLSDVWLSGGGAVIEPLRHAIADTLDMQVHKAEELVRSGGGVANCYDCLQAIGITLE